MNSAEYLARCAALTRRGLSLACAADLADAANPVLLCELEDTTDETLARISDAYQRTQAAAESLAVSAATLLSVQAGLCGAPLLWDGDQA